MIFISVIIFLIAVALPIKLTSVILIRLTLLTFITQIILTTIIHNSQSLWNGVNIYGGFLEISEISYFLDIFIYIFASFAIIPWSSYNIARNIKIPIKSLYSLTPTNSYYSILILFSVIGSSLLVSSNSIISIFLTIELQSFALYIIASLYRDSNSSTNAGLIYFLLGGLSSCLILLGISQIYNYLGIFTYQDIYSIINIDNIEDNINIALGFSIIILTSGLFFKIAAAPFHNWSPDVYDQVPTIVTIWLAVIPKLAIIGILVKMSEIWINSINVNSFDIIKSVFTFSAIFSIIIGAIIGLSQIRIKRLLAYSTISHVGFILLALSSFSAETNTIFIFYLGQYTITSLATFAIILGFGYLIRTNNNNIIINFPNRNHYTDIEYLSEIAGKITQYPGLTITFAILLFSIAGVPPFAGFWAKQSILELAIQSQYIGSVFVGIVSSIISASYYLKIVILMHFKSTYQTDNNNNNSFNNMIIMVSSSVNKS